ncbi:hypothetical protein E1162_13570 [Rhodobacteraceae bacterium RKSG542]|uniref:hypothetical protein n=1 Tax=Pseudovibrio flavus TaxID=2529854 RepID=UPI0012BBB992|nr:hypothetical protein [Pseudovibrio flavus]MTI18270.1 hypothetical protein [Pseudovibrio flavus]
MPLRASLTLLASSLFLLPAAAKDFPAGYYIATDGQAEQLTIRAEPSSKAPVAAQLPATKVLVSSGISEKADGTLWQQVSSGEM